MVRNRVAADVKLGDPPPPTLHDHRFWSTLGFVISLALTRCSFLSLRSFFSACPCAWYYRLLIFPLLLVKPESQQENICWIWWSVDCCASSQPGGSGCTQERNHGMAQEARCVFLIFSRIPLILWEMEMGAWTSLWRWLECWKKFDQG